MTYQNYWVDFNKADEQEPTNYLITDSMTTATVTFNRLPLSDEVTSVELWGSDAYGDPVLINKRSRYHARVNVLDDFGEIYTVVEDEDIEAENDTEAVEKIIEIARIMYGNVDLDDACAMPVDEWREHMQMCRAIGC